MSILLAKKEIDAILPQLGVTDYYMEIDMNGGMTLIVSPDFSDRQEEIQASLETRDKNRTPDDIYDVGEMLFPLKRVVVADDEDEETLELLAKRELVRARYSQQLNTWLKPQEGDKGKERPPRVVFYSYKGGVGRSTALAIVARILAKQGFTVAVVDLDLEAPGLNSLLLTDPKSSPFGVVDYLYHAPWIRNTMTRERFISQYVVREEVRRRNEKPGQVFVMSAGGTVVRPKSSHVNLLFDKDDVEIMLEPNYLEKLSYIDFDVYARQSTHVFEQLLDDLGTFTGAQIILLDARTGISNVSGALIKQFSDVLSVHIQDNRQNREGIEFIANYIGQEKLKNTIWSHTKVPRHYPRAVEELQGFIWSEVDKKAGENSERVDLNFHHLAFDSDLENINAQQLKKYMESDRFFEYQELTEKIVDMAGIEKKLSSFYVSDEDRRNIITDLGRLAKEQVKVTYISPRFLNQDLELFVGFPGSGKKTFADHMLKRHGKQVETIGFESFIEKKKGTHRTLTKTAFLDWSFDEASQALCKWLLQSDVFFTWVLNNEHFSGVITPEELDEMRKNPEYELSAEIAVAIMEMVFKGEEGIQRDGWRFLFNFLRYRQDYVLPQDIIRGVQSFILYYSAHIEETNGVRALMSTQRDFSFYLTLWEPIGQQKRQWLESYDQKLFALVAMYNSLDQESAAYIGASEEVIKERMRKQFSEMNEELITNTINKAFNMEILWTNRLSFGESSLNITTLSPVYRFIRVKNA